MTERQALQTMLRLWDQHCGLWSVREQINECRAALGAEPSDEDVERATSVMFSNLQKLFWVRLRDGYLWEQLEPSEKKGLTDAMRTAIAALRTKS